MSGLNSSEAGSLWLSTGLDLSELDRFILGTVSYGCRSVERMSCAARAGANPIIENSMHYNACRSG